MRVRAASVRRKLFVAVLVLTTLVPLVVYVYSRGSGGTLAAERLAAHVERSVARALDMKRELEPILMATGPRSQAVYDAMERLVVNDESIAYIQLADRMARVVNSTAHAPVRNRVPLMTLPPAPPEMVAPGLVERRGELGPPEFVVDLRAAGFEPYHMVVGLSMSALHRQLEEFRNPLRWSSLHIAIICVAILAVFSAYIVYLHEHTRALHAQLQEESRLAYVGTLAAGIAHEVRNPLSSVKMNVQMMENRLQQLVDREQAEYFHTKVDRIKGEVERLEDSVSHFLAFARPQPLRPEPARLNDVVDNVLELLQPQCQSRSIQLVRRYARDLPPVSVDSRQLIQAVQNLVLNAMQALDRNGTITVATEAREGGVAIAVSDNGPGIPQEIQDRIFEVFYTTRQGGTGLGLNIVSRIVEEHRGRVTVESRPGGGSTFRIELPIGTSREEGEEHR